MDTHKLPLIIIMGPTGAGKSDFALELAQQINGEIINCDVGQFYTPLSIGTAKPDWQNSSIPHHLFDILSEPKNFSVTAFRARVQKLIAEIRARKRTPIIVGGSGFYVNALFFPPREEQYSEHTIADVSWERLNRIDPVRAQHIHPHDTYRIERALQIWEQTGVLPSEQKPVFSPVSDNFLLVHIERDRQELYERINARTHAMIDLGWLDEVRKLSPAWHTFLEKKKLIGYPEIITFLSTPEKLSEQLIKQIQQSTRHYAKRQIIFWRMLAKKLQEAQQGDRLMRANLTLSPVDLYIRQLLEKISYQSE